MLVKEIIVRYASIIADYKVITWEIEPTSSRFKARITFLDGSSLLIKDYLFAHGRKYAYQWQDSAGSLKMRWDNAPHWKHVETFPHHRHELEDVFPSREVDLEDVLQYISDTNSIVGKR